MVVFGKTVCLFVDCLHETEDRTRALEHDEFLGIRDQQIESVTVWTFDDTHNGQMAKAESVQ